MLTHAAVQGIERLPHAVGVVMANGQIQYFDQIVLATHADQALRILAVPSDAEQRVLGVFRYARNSAYLHTDIALMPRRRRAWAS